MDSTERSINRTELTGILFILVSLVMIFGITTSEAIVRGYSSSTQTISELGSDSGTEHSNMIFNGSLIFSGILIIFSTYLVTKYYNVLLAATFLLTGLGMIGTGVFPLGTGYYHAIPSLMWFVGAGMTALFVSAIVVEPYRYLSAGVAALELGTLILWLMTFLSMKRAILTIGSVILGSVIVHQKTSGQSKYILASVTVIVASLFFTLTLLNDASGIIQLLHVVGIGGVERWVVYSNIVWFATFGGYLLS